MYICPLYICATETPQIKLTAFCMRWQVLAVIAVIN